MEFYTVEDDEDDKSFATSFKNLSINCPKLRLSACGGALYQVKDWSIASLLEHFSFRDILCLGHSKNVTDMAFKYLSDKCVSFFPLKVLDLCECTRLTDDSFFIICQNFVNLERLYLDHCHKFTGANLEI